MVHTICGFAHPLQGATTITTGYIRPVFASYCVLLYYRWPFVDMAKSHRSCVVLLLLCFHHAVTLTPKHSLCHNDKIHDAYTPNCTLCYVYERNTSESDNAATMAPGSNITCSEVERILLCVTLSNMLASWCIKPKFRVCVDAPCSPSYQVVHRSQRRRSFFLLFLLPQGP